MSLPRFICSDPCRESHQCRLGMSAGSIFHRYLISTGVFHQHRIGIILPLLSCAFLVSYYDLESVCARGGIFARADVCHRAHRMRACARARGQTCARLRHPTHPPIHPSTHAAARYHTHAQATPVTPRSVDDCMMKKNLVAIGEVKLSVST